MINIRLIFFIMFASILLSGCFTHITGITKAGKGEYYITTKASGNTGTSMLESGLFGTNMSANAAISNVRKCKSEENGDLICSY